jgi:protein required for attachment to host cells
MRSGQATATLALHCYRSTTMRTTWILAADRAKARLFAFDRDSDAIVELEDFVNPDSRGREPPRDRPPRAHDRQGASRHVIEPHTQPGAKADATFARELDSVLEQGRVDHRYEDLVLIAPPRFLGALNAALGSHVRAHVVAELPKGIAGADARDIVAQLPASLRKAPRRDRPAS